MLYYSMLFARLLVDLVYWSPSGFPPLSFGTVSQLRSYHLAFTPPIGHHSGCIHCLLPMGVVIHVSSYMGYSSYHFYCSVYRRTWHTCAKSFIKNVKIAFCLRVKSEYLPESIWTPGFVTWVLLFSRFFLLSFLTLCLCLPHLGYLLSLTSCSFQSFFLLCALHMLAWLRKFSSRWVICLSLSYGEYRINEWHTSRITSWLEVKICFVHCRRCTWIAKFCLQWDTSSHVAKLLLDVYIYIRSWRNVWHLIVHSNAQMFKGKFMFTSDIF